MDPEMKKEIRELIWMFGCAFILAILGYIVITLIFVC